MNRRRLSRLGVWVFVSIVAVGGVFATSPGGVGNLLRDLRDCRGNAEQLVAEAAKEKQHLAALSTTHERVAYRKVLCDQLVHREVELPAAAEAYLNLLAADPILLTAFRRSVPGRTDEERVGVNLVSKALTDVARTESDRQALLNEFRTFTASITRSALPTAVKERGNSSSSTTGVTGGDVSGVDEIERAWMEL